MPVKSICLFTVACLMQLLSFGFHAGHVVFRMAPAATDLRNAAAPDTEIAADDNSPAASQLAIFPSPLQFAN